MPQQILSGKCGKVLFFLRHTTVYHANLNFFKPTLKDFAQEVYPYEAEVLDVGSKPRSMQLVPLERIDEDRKGIDTMLYPDSKYIS